MFRRYTYKSTFYTHLSKWIHVIFGPKMTETQVDPTTLNEVRDFLLEHEADKKRLGILKLWKYEIMIS